MDAIKMLKKIEEYESLIETNKNNIATLEEEFEKSMLPLRKELRNNELNKNKIISTLEENNLLTVNLKNLLEEIALLTGCEVSDCQSSVEMNVKIYSNYGESELKDYVNEVFEQNDKIYYKVIISLPNKNLKIELNQTLDFNSVDNNKYIFKRHHKLIKENGSNYYAFILDPRYVNDLKIQFDYYSLKFTPVIYSDPNLLKKAVVNTLKKTNLVKGR